ncbi:MAG: thioredoxin domain-containing protein, partial [Verrucomicrobiota bacterium]
MVKFKAEIFFPLPVKVQRLSCPVPSAWKYFIALSALIFSAGCSDKNQNVKIFVEQKHSHTNRLAGEKSPYLLQHQHNPVDWFPWGEEAFAKARAENKPIFLSIGYSTCHWCHVMERESFENETVAKYLNEHFVSIKVDREERPDVDQIYMTAAQAMTGQGGWPLNCFLMPDLKPFYCGTYFPPEAKYGRPSFLQVLQQISQAWQTRHGDVAASADDLHRKLDQITSHQTNRNILLTPAILYNAAAQFKAEFDSENGGFGGAPKFPRPSQ